MEAKRSLGQNFLKSDSALERIADCVDIEKNENVVEIGPGHGELTSKLLERGASVVAVEIDRDLTVGLRERFADEIESNRLKIVEADVREISVADILKGGERNDYKLVGNIPYYITGFIIRNFLSERPRPKKIVFLLQREVAQRVALSKKESLLSLSVKAYGEPKYCGVVKAGSFSPVPKVDSAILLIDSITDGFESAEDEKLFFHILKLGFSQKRKTVIGNLSNYFEREILESLFEEIEIDRKARAEDLSIKTWKYLATLVKDRCKRYRY